MFWHPYVYCACLRYTTTLLNNISVPLYGLTRTIDADSNRNPYICTDECGMWSFGDTCIIILDRYDVFKRLAHILFSTSLR